MTCGDLNDVGIENTVFGVDDLEVREDEELCLSVGGSLLVLERSMLDASGKATDGRGKSGVVGEKNSMKECLDVSWEGRG